MIYPLVRELAVDGIPVDGDVPGPEASLASPTTGGWPTRSRHAELEAAYRANALFDAHRDDPEFGYRFLADEARDAGQRDG